MALVDELAEWKEIPHEPGNDLQLRPLSGTERDEAEHKQRKRALSIFEGLDLPKEMMDLLREEGRARNEKIRAAQDAASDAIETAFDEETKPGDKYDPQTTVKYGVVAWRGPVYTTPFSPAALANLDAATRDFAHDQVVAMSDRSAGEGTGSRRTSDGESSAASASQPTASGAAD